MPLPLVAPQSFNDAQSAFIDHVVSAYADLSKTGDIIAGVKDVNSRHIIATDSYAHLVALAHGADVSGRLDREMPNEGTASFADQYVKEDLELLGSSLPGHVISVLNVHYYHDGLQARLFDKRILWHHESNAVLGLRYLAQDVDLGNLAWLIHDHMRIYGTGCSLRQTIGEIAQTQGGLTQQEQVVCFFLLLNWQAKHINEYMVAIRSPEAGRINTVIGTISEKLRLPTSNLNVLREKLVSLDMQTQIPAALFQALIGSCRLSCVTI